MSGTRAGNALRALTLRPGRALRGVAVLTALAGLGVVLAALLLPASDARFEHDRAQGLVQIETPFGVRTMEPDAALTLSAASSRSDPGQSETITAAELAEPETLPPTVQSAIDAMFRSGPVKLEIAGDDAAHWMIARKRPQLSELGAGFWLIELCALAALAAGLAVYVLRPATWAGTTYAILGVSLFVSATTTVFYTLTDGGTPQGALAALLRTDQTVLQIFDLGWLALFARFPHAVLPRSIVLAVVTLIAVVAIPAQWIWDIGMEARATLQVGTYLVMLGLLAAQFIMVRARPAQRRSLYIVLGCIAVGTFVFLLLTVLPLITPLRLPFNEVATMPLYVLIYCGIGIAIVRTRLFGFDGWVRHVFAAICLVGAVLLIDMLLVNWLTRQDETVLGLAIAIVALIYWPVRERLVRKAELERDARMRASLRLAADVSFAATPAERASRWREAVEASFQPLEIGIDSNGASVPTLSDDGESLHLPAMGDAPALVCRHAGGGQRLFGLDDVASAEALYTIVDQLTRSREAYTEGVAQERRRIARDLHDDVSGRLMTSLHRGEVSSMRRDVREAMADIRTIVTGLADEPRSLPDLLADLRHETMSRLEGTGITLDWPISYIPMDGPPLRYEVYRHITSILREGVSNAVRHAGPQIIRVSAVVSEDVLTLEITDEGGRGGKTGHDGPGGNGLANCRRRAEEIGGRFDFARGENGSRAALSAPL